MRDFGSDFGVLTHTRETAQGVSGVVEASPASFSFAPEPLDRRHGI
jgi:hypothetical protein